jgi:hypothetical protein
MRFLSEGRPYVANVVDGKVTMYSSEPVHTEERIDCVFIDLFLLMTCQVSFSICALSRR